MTQEEFFGSFRNEKSARLYWRKLREDYGLICKRCGHKEHLWQPVHQHWRCKRCRSSINLRSGTVMEASHLPVLTWLKAIFLMVNTKKGLSALEMQRQLGLKRYQPAWYMMQKIRLVMGSREQSNSLKGFIEMDDALVKVIKDEKPPEGRYKPGRGSEKRTPILVMASSKKKHNPKTNRPSTVPGFFKMYVLESVNGNDISQLAQSAISRRSRILSDGYSAYRKLAETFPLYRQENIPASKASLKLPWVHTAIGNLKRYLDGITHHVSDRYLQNYLNEFTYKLNRRNKPDIFNRLIHASIEFSWV